jgi:alanine racemase
MNAMNATHAMNDHPLIWAEVDLGAIAHNVRELRRLTLPQARVMAVVKANGYGHGALEVARTALASGAEWLGVARLAEGIHLRETPACWSISTCGSRSPPSMPPASIPPPLARGAGASRPI